MRALLGAVLIKLERHAEAEATLRAVKHRPPVRELGEVRVKGKQEAVRIYAVGAKGESQPPFTQIP